MNQRNRPGRPAFAMVELAAIIAVVLLMLALAASAMRRERGAMWNAADSENLHRFASATTAYAADNDELYWGFSWKRASFEGERLPTDYVDMQTKNETDVRACIAQAVDLLRRKAGREDMSYISNWYPHVYYSQLMLYDYLDEHFPPQWGVAPSDRLRLMWAQDPAGFDQGEFLPDQPQPNNENKRWPYSSSYELPSAFYDHGQAGNRVVQAFTHSKYFIPETAELGPTRMADVAFPSQKVHLHESQRDFGRNVFFAALEARIALLFADGSAGIRATGDANLGWQPNSPESVEPTLIVYTPQRWEAPTANGQPTETVPGYYRWTRGGLGGRDFGGPEVGFP